MLPALRRTASLHSVDAPERLCAAVHKNLDYVILQHQVAKAGTAAAGAARRSAGARAGKTGQTCATGLGWSSSMDQSGKV